ncbi:glycoside hydrolase family 65 protein [Flavobacteriaceae bacterium]|nr:glycoside hydrolase family 65 protein [Flavobacteriaceae bacterium]
MNLNYIKPSAWSIIEEGFTADHVTASESIFSIGNGAMGQRANFEEFYSGDTFQGSYIGGIYYPDKTRVGWWKNGYPEYFAKVLNAPNWIGIDIVINGTVLDLNTCELSDFVRELNMKEGWLKRHFTAKLPSGDEIKVIAERFLSLTLNEVGAINYEIEALNFSGSIEAIPYVDAGISNEDTNYDELFWSVGTSKFYEHGASILSTTLKTGFEVCTGFEVSFEKNGSKIQDLEGAQQVSEKRVGLAYSIEVAQGDRINILKFGGYVQSMNHNSGELTSVSKNVLDKASQIGYAQLKHDQIKAWAKVWETADITIEGDVKAQQAIRFNIFQLNQTYSGEDHRLNIGPKGFTGEKYGGSTYWDTEAYCIPFYMSTKDKEVARNLLVYRYKQLDPAIENAKKLGFTNGAALYPMVTMNGEECHNEWEITFEEIHRNGAMIYAIYNYVNYTGDFSYIPEYGMEVMVAISRFWKQRSNYSQAKGQYVILGVTGPNEYENNINNNFYTNYLAKWCMEYTAETLSKLKTDYSSDFDRIVKKLNLSDKEVAEWLHVATNMYFPFSEEHGVYLQQDGFLDKELIPVEELPTSQRPINQHWSWDRILRSCYIKQADTLQGLYFFEDRFTKEEIEKHFDFYEPITVHESSLSPCVHSILAASIDRMPKAYEQYLRTSRLDLDDYNHEVHEGLHITSMAGTWLSIVQGFGGMRNFHDKLSFNPQIPEQWESYSFKLNYRGATIKVEKSQNHCIYKNLTDAEINIWIGDQEYHLEGNTSITI